MTCENVNKPLKGRQKVNAFKSGFFSLKEIQEKALKILTLKESLQRLPIALAQVKTGRNSENLLNKIRKIAYSLYQSK